MAQLLQEEIGSTAQTTFIRTYHVEVREPEGALESHLSTRWRLCPRRGRPRLGYVRTAWTIPIRATKSTSTGSAARGLSSCSTAHRIHLECCHLQHYTPSVG
uniref:(northern house mosquito) hypothetical protein n=1 Tax=Culex pipiens TaxID=7175 RepID=A0A8D8ASG8_CULPI